MPLMAKCKYCGKKMETTKTGFYSRECSIKAFRQVNPSGSAKKRSLTQVKREEKAKSG
jgi:hypothetical protein